MQHVTWGDLNESYTLGAELGMGAFARVRLCEHKETGKSYACKTMRKDDVTFGIAGIQNELTAMRQLAGNLSIVQLHEAIEDDEYVHLICDLCDGDLFEWLRSHHGFLHEDRIRAVFRSVMTAVEGCHRASILHRDIKLENFFVVHREGGEDAVVLGDFGLAVELREEEGGLTSGRAGSRTYLAPEVVGGQKYGTKADIWCCGVLLHYLVSKTAPFPHFEDREGGQREAKLTGGPWSSISEDLKALLAQMLSFEPDIRPSAGEVLARLSPHQDRAWFLSSTLLSEDVPISCAPLEADLSFAEWRDNPPAVPAVAVHAVGGNLKRAAVGDGGENLGQFCKYRKSDRWHTWKSSLSVDVSG